jgi:tetratricopeptide (TPR) repeat protein
VSDLELAVASKVFGEGDARTASGKANLGRLYMLEGKLADAERLLVDAVRVHETVLPAGHPDRIASENGLATLYAAQGRSAGAEQMIQKVTKDAPQLGEQHPLYAASLVELAGVYRLAGRPGRGQPLLRKALAIYETSIGPDCPPVAYTLLFMSIDALSANEPALAENQLRRALDIFRKTNGPDHPMTALAEYRLAQAYSQQMKYGEAELLLKHALTIQEGVYPNGHMAIADTLYGLAEVEAVQRRYTDAEWNYQRAISIYENLDQASPSLAIALQHYAKVLRIKRTTEAKALERRAIELGQAAK